MLSIMKDRKLQLFNNIILFLLILLFVGCAINRHMVTCLSDINNEPRINNKEKELLLKSKIECDKNNDMPSSSVVLEEDIQILCE